MNQGSYTDTPSRQARDENANERQMILRGAVNIRWARWWLQDNCDAHNLRLSENVSWFGCDTDEELEAEIKEVAEGERLDAVGNLQAVLEVMLFG